MNHPKLYGGLGAQYVRFEGDRVFKTMDQHEFDLTRTAAAYGIAPPIINHRIIAPNDAGHTIEMETLKYKVIQNYQQPNGTLDSTFKQILCTQYRHQLENHMKILHALGIYYYDFHLKNVVFEESATRIYLIDFELSQDVNHIQPERRYKIVNRIHSSYITPEKLYQDDDRNVSEHFKRYCQKAE
jgi:tRNA A-37 threonylcarbamoyl transferase component Bud32